MKKRFLLGITLISLVFLFNFFVTFVFAGGSVEGTKKEEEKRLKLRKLKVM